MGGVLFTARRLLASRWAAWRCFDDYKFNSYQRTTGLR